MGIFGSSLLYSWILLPNEAYLENWIIPSTPLNCPLDLRMPLFCLTTITIFGRFTNPKNLFWPFTYHRMVNELNVTNYFYDLVLLFICNYDYNLQFEYRSCS